MRKLLVIAASGVIAIASLVLLNVLGGNAQAYGGARDCDDIAIVRCGVHSTSELVAAFKGSASDAYVQYGIKKSDLTGQTSQVVQGQVYKNGNVVVGGKVVATGAWSSGRKPLGHDRTIRTPGGNVFYEQQTQHGFRANSIDAYVLMRDGKFFAAVLTSCGNPVRATPKPVPVFSCKSLVGIISSTSNPSSYRFTATAAARDAKITKYVFDYGDGTTDGTVATSATTATVNHAYAKPGTYTVKATVYVSVNGVTKIAPGTCTYKVTIPPAQTAVCTELTKQKISRTEYSFTTKATVAGGAAVTKYVYNFGDGKVQQPIASTATTNTTKYTYAAARDYNVSVTVYAKINGVEKALTAPACTTKVTVEDLQKEPVFSCDSLEKTKISRTSYQLKAAATAKDGATITSYSFNFGDGTPAQVVTTNAGTATSQPHVYTTPRTYTATVTVNISVNGVNKPTTGTHCSVQIVVEDEPVTPVYKCDALTARLIKLEDRNYGYNLAYTAEGGATLKNVDFNFGDGTTKTYQVNELTNITHAYAKADTYKTTATLHFNVPKEGGVTVVDANCETSITVSPEMCPTNPSLPKNHPDCGPCTVPGKEHLPKDSPLCKADCTTPGHENDAECVTTPVELPHTGIGEMAASVLGLGSIVAAGYYFVVSRRGLLDAISNR